MAGIILVVQVIPIWISVKAKRIGGKPYRWGTYVGIITGLFGAVFASGRLSASDNYGREIRIALCVSAILCSVGILRRRKYGVVLFVITYLLLMMAVPFISAMRDEPLTPQQQGQSFPTLVFLGLTTGYFVKRWRLMGKPRNAMMPPPAPPMTPPIPPSQRL
jgi:drug/metabolite transporter (DMT)-like permease